MQGTSKRLKKALREHAGRAWEAEMAAALAALAAKFDAWKVGTMSTADLDVAIHEHHNGIARDIWKRFSIGDVKVPLAQAVASGVVSKESLPPEVVAHIAPLLEYFQAR